MSFITAAKINAFQAHQISDEAIAARYTEYLSDLHKRVKREAQTGKYSFTITLTNYANRKFDIVRYFALFGYSVTIGNRDTLTVAW